MHMIHNQHLSEMNQILSLYQVLHISQLYCFFPKLPEATVTTLVKRMTKQDRISYEWRTGIIRRTGADDKKDEIISALWVMLDFFPAVTFHTIGNFPSMLTFYTEGEGYDVISVPPEKELLYRQALPEQPGGNKRLVVIQDTGQIRKIDFPQIAAYCLVSEDGRIQYFKKQGDPHDQ